MPSIWVAELRVSDQTAEKIASKHGLEVGAVRQAIVCVEGLPYVIDIDPQRGERAIVRTAVAGRECDLVLYNARHPLGDVWHLGSAYPT